MSKILTIKEFWGRRGNCYWTIAALFGLARKHGYVPLLPTGTSFKDELNLPPSCFQDFVIEQVITEKKHGHDPEFLNEAKKDIIGIKGCFQSYLYWIDIKDEIMSMLKPKEQLDFGPNSVGVHIRMGDYKNNPGYVQYSAEYYKSAMEKYFSDPRYVFYIVSDDYQYLTDNFKGDRYILAKRTDYEDFITLCGCRNHIMSGSSFSFWSTFLSDKQGINIRVPRTHTGHLAHLDESSSYMPDWIPHTDEKRVVLACYSDKKYESFQNRLVETNNNNKQFDEVFSYNREWLESTDFYGQNKSLLDSERGGGYWVWKPYLILETLKKLRDGDVLLYMDSGDIFFGEIRKFLVDTMADKHIMLTESGTIQKDYTKRDCFVEMDCDGPEYHNTNQVEAGVITVKNSAKSRYLLKEWFNWCCNAHVIDDSPNTMGDNFDTFIDHRHDQSILTNLKVLHNIYTSPAIREYVACNVGETPGRIDLTDVTWIIPVKWDHQDREDNLNIVLDWLQARFDTNIIVGEQGSDHRFQYVEKRGVKYMYFDMEFFHRTRMLNLMTVAANTNIIFNHDADVVLLVDAVIEAVELMRSGNAFVYPYSGAFLRTPRQYHQIIKSTKSVEPLVGMKFKGYGDESVGGSVGFLRDRYWGEDPLFFSHAPEDVQRAKFMGLLGGYLRVNYPLFHLEHFIGPDSHHAHEWAVFNKGEWRRIKEIKTAQDATRYMSDHWPGVRDYWNTVGYKPIL